MNQYEERFWQKVDKSSDCWNWTGTKDKRGYGHAWDGSRFGQAHRYAYEIHTGKKPQGVIDHICRNTGCVRPSHLREVTQKQNQENRASEQRNNKSGYRGVSLHKTSGLWQAKVTHNGEQFHLGYYKDPADAGAVALSKRLELFTCNETDNKPNIDQQGP